MWTCSNGSKKERFLDAMDMKYDLHRMDGFVLSLVNFNVCVVIYVCSFQGVHGENGVCELARKDAVLIFC